jgi:hypothetical protein
MDILGNVKEPGTVISHPAGEACDTEPSRETDVFDGWWLFNHGLLFLPGALRDPEDDPVFAWRVERNQDVPYVRFDCQQTLVDGMPGNWGRTICGVPAEYGEKLKTYILSMTYIRRREPAFVGLPRCAEIEVTVLGRDIKLTCFGLSCPVVSAEIVPSLLVGCPWRVELSRTPADVAEYLKMLVAGDFSILS